MDVPSEYIWTITQSNLELALSKINLSDGAETDIRNAVNAGKIATAHETQINFNGWVGEGYTLVDPNTGAGAYMIAGGGNGAIMMIYGLTALIMLGFVAVLSGGVGAVLALGLINAYLAIFLKGLSLVLNGLGLETTSAVACGAFFVVLGGVLAALLMWLGAAIAVLSFLANGVIATIISELFGLTTLFLNCV